MKDLFLYRHKKLLAVMAVVFFALLAVDKLVLQEPPPPLSQQIAGTDAMVFFRAAYDDPAVLKADLAELDRLSQTSMENAKIFLQEGILRTSLNAFERAVMRAPDAPLEKLHNYIIANMGAFLPECAESIAPQITTITAKMQPAAPQTPPGHKPRFYIYKLMADVIDAAGKNPSPPATQVKTPDQLARFYSMTEIMVMKQEDMDALMQRISSGTQTPQDSCTLLLVEANALDYVPQHAYRDMLKGAVIAGVRLRLTDGPIAP